MKKTEYNCNNICLTTKACNQLQIKATEPNLLKFDFERMTAIPRKMKKNNHHPVRSYGVMK